MVDDAGRGGKRTMRGQFAPEEDAKTDQKPLSWSVALISTESAAEEGLVYIMEGRGNQ